MSSRTISDVERGLRGAVYRDTAARLAAALGLADEHKAAFLAVARGHARMREDGLWSTDAEFGTAGTTLPAQVTRLIGRERELIVVVGALKDPARRLVTLTGPGGIGKTRLAIEASAMARADFPGGVFFVSLAADDVPSHVLPIIVRAMGITRAREPLMDAVVERLGGKHCLLVLDTFEHVLEAAPLVAVLLARCPDAKVLATSREPLHLRGEHEFPVPALAVPPDTLVMPEHLAWYPATVLFEERATAARPDLVIDAGAAQIIAEICRRLDGLPLAIELAAARVRHLPLRALNKQLDHRLDVLIGGPRDLPRRQQTMRQTVAWSYDLLGSTEQSLVRCLSVFAGHLTVDAAQSVCRPDGGLDEVLALMSALVDKSLLMLREGPSGQPGYAMLDVVREYAAERLQELGEADHLRDRHAEYFSTVAETAEVAFGTAGQQDWFDRLDAEHEDFRAALRWAIERRASDRALRLGGALWQFWRSHGDYVEGRAWLRAALALDGSASPDVRAKALWGAAGLAYHNGDYADARALSDELLLLARATNDAVHMRNALTIRGVVAMAAGRFPEATGPLREALEICRALGPSWLLGTSYLNLGGALMHSGDIDGARSNLDQAARTYRRVGDRAFAARATHQLGYLALLTGSESRARSSFRAALATFRELNDRWGVAEALEGFAALSAANGMADRAARLAGAAESFRDAFGARTLPVDRVSLDGYLAAARRSVDRTVWREAWNAGRQMTLEEAIELALADSPGSQRRRA